MSEVDIPRGLLRPWFGGVFGGGGEQALDSVFSQSSGLGLTLVWEGYITGSISCLKGR